MVLWTFVCQVSHQWCLKLQKSSNNILFTIYTCIYVQFDKCVDLASTFNLKTITILSIYNPVKSSPVDFSKLQVYLIH